MGWLMAGLPESAGGLGGDAYDLAVVAEEFGRASVTEPVVETATAMEVLLALTPARKRPS